MPSDHENNHQINVKDSLHRFVGALSKTTMKKSLATIKQIYNKYADLPDFITDFSDQVYKELLVDALPTLT